MIPRAQIYLIRAFGGVLILPVQSRPVYAPVVATGKRGTIVVK
jgi:hypothetical protein